MQERPILFSGAMVRAILEGRKTQSRRIVNLQTGETFDEHALVGAVQEWRPVVDGGRVVGKRAAVVRCPYGMPGDRLWVRETWQPLWSGDKRPHSLREPAGWDIHYPASDGVIEFHDVDTGLSSRCRPSIHMPRWASRIDLDVTEVRIEGLHDISEDDAIAEGVTIPPADVPRLQLSARQTFAVLWDSINSKRAPWASNPWVWVVEFKVAK